jgi:hypothetical protein
VKKSKIFLLLLFLFCLNEISRSQDIIPDSLVRERIQVIENMLDNGKKNANIWWYGWLVGYGTATIAQGAVFLYSDKLSTRQDMGLGAFTTILGMGSQLIDPMVPGYASEYLEEISEGTPEENLVKLSEAEKLLEECAKREKEGRSWKIQALDGAVNLGCGMIVWLGFKRSLLESFANVALNTAICEAQIFTQPTRAIKDYDRYCKEYKSNQNLIYCEPKISWSFYIVPGGIGIRMRF